MAEMPEKERPADAGLVESDCCDLDPNKLCDNCCRCLESRDADYIDINAALDADSMRIYYGEEEDELNLNELPPMDIDPALLAEWEEKRRQKEWEDERRGQTADGEDALYTKHDPARMRGTRKRREKP